MGINAAHEILKNLNAEQKTAVEWNDQESVAILAGAGTGKTTVLCARVVHLLRNKLAAAAEICCVTFTASTGREFKNKLDGLLGDKVEDTYVGTLHGLAYKILKRQGKKIDIAPNFIVLSSPEQLQIFKDYCPSAINYDAKMLGYIRKTISGWKNTGIDPTSMSEELPVEIMNIWNEYHQFCREKNYLDFDDLIIYASKIPQLYKHVLVDEFQDLNDSQSELCSNLMNADGGNIYLVGDEDQKIYSFRGAELSFQKYNRDIKITKLFKNYRSVKPILDLANTLIEENIDRLPKRLVSHMLSSATTTPPCLYITPDAVKENDFVSKSIRKLKRGTEIKYSDIAIIARTKQNLSQIEVFLAIAGVPFSHLSVIPFVEKKEFKASIALMRLLTNENDILGWCNALPIVVGIGEKTIKKFIRSILSDGNIRETCDAYPKTKVLFELLKVLTDQKTNENFSKSERLTIILNGILDITCPESSAIKIGILETFNIYTSRNSKLEIDDLLLDFCAEIHLGTAEHEGTTNKVQLLTVHAAKGKEYEAVYILNVENGSFPHFKNKNIEEERRLLFVAITRAKKYLILTNARTRFNHETQKTKSTSTSSFLLRAMSEGKIKRIIKEER